MPKLTQGPSWQACAATGRLLQGIARVPGIGMRRPSGAASALGCDASQRRTHIKTGIVQAIPMESVVMWLFANVVDVAQVVSEANRFLPT